MTQADELRSAAEDLIRRAKALDERERQLAETQTALEQSRATLDATNERLERIAIQDEARQEEAERRIRELEAALAKALAAPAAEPAPTPSAFAELGSNELTDASLLGEARQRVQLAIAAKGMKCPCCGQLAKIYKRKINASMAKALIMFYRYVSGFSDTWVHVAKETQLSRLGGDWARLEQWGFIESKAEDREDNGPHSGIWRITEKGCSFVRGEINVPSHVLIYDGDVLRFDEQVRITIRESLGDRFDYEELMGTRGVAHEPVPAAVSAEVH